MADSIRGAPRPLVACRSLDDSDLTCFVFVNDHDNYSLCVHHVLIPGRRFQVVVFSYEQPLAMHRMCKRTEWRGEYDSSPPPEVEHLRLDSEDVHSSSASAEEGGV